MSYLKFSSRAIPYSFESREYPHSLILFHPMANKVLKDQIENCAIPVFSKCSKYIYFIQKDQNYRPCRLMRHKIGDVYWEETKEMYYAEDERVYLNIHVTKDSNWYV